MKKINRRQPWDAFLVTFPVLIVFLLTPLQIYLPNQADFQYEHEIMIVFLVVYVFSLALSWLFIKTMPEKWLYRITVISFYSGLYLLLSTLFVPVQVGELVGKNELDVIAEPLYLSMIEILLCLGVIFVAIKSPWEKIREIGIIFSILTLLGMIGLFLLQIKIPDNKTSAPIEAVTNVSTNGPNVYHLVFDAFDPILFENLIDILDVREQFNGFTFYKNNICNYTTTTLSVPSAMTGKFLDGNITKNDFNALSGGIIRSLKDIGYRITQYDMYFPAHEATDHFASQHTIESDLNRKSNIFKLADLSILVAAPNFLQNECFVKSKGVLSRLILSKNDVLNNWIDPMISLELIERLILDEDSRASHGEYVGTHFLLPHPPYSLDQNCNFIGKQSSNLRSKEGQLNLKNQNLCTVNQIIKIIGRLKEMERFESSLIIIQSDHGELKRSTSLLLVKKPGAHDTPLEISGFFTHLLDVAPTVLDAVGLKNDHLQGQSLLLPESSGSRDFPLALGLNRSKELSYYTWREGKIIKKNPAIIRTDRH